MKIALPTVQKPHSLLRKCGYHSSGADKKTGQLVFIKQLGTSDYPRFHAYLKFDEVSRETIINLHLDQKKPVYRGAVAHSAEYEGKLVEKEVERIKQILGPIAQR